MITYDVKKSKIFEELGKEESNYWFDRVREKYIHNLDSIYYVCYLDVENYNDNIYVSRFLEYLELKKNFALDNLDDAIYDEVDTSLYTNGMGFGMYAYSIIKNDCYVVFVARTKASEDTPEIFVQLRSQYLWLYGEHRAVEDSYKDIVSFLDFFNLKISRVQENRIDYAYHTNYIQDPLNFFKEDNLNSMQVSRFTRWHKEGRFVGDDDVECDYLSLGRRKSNNTFVRIYNKTQEVINQQYKQFFIKIWLLNGLINRYDYYILENCFKHGSYNYVDNARLDFYIDYGLDDSLKEEIKINKEIMSFVELKKYADSFMPKLTLVCNIEIQTKRKFYNTMDKAINNLKTVTCKYIELERLFKILDNKDLFHDYITTDVIRFVNRNSHTRKKNCDVSSWWRRLQNIKLYNVIDDNNRKLIREYQNNLDYEVVKRRVLNSLSTLSIYIDSDNNNSIEKDVLNMLGSVNESDVEKAMVYKRKKSALLKNRLEGVNNIEVISPYILVDSETAEIIG